jgi:hypothetical protein
VSLPLNTNPGKLGLIEVFEDDEHFLVRIHPGNRDRAKKISRRQWDGNRKVWVYPKDRETYEALVEEFQKDADKFDIRLPKTQRPPGMKPPVKETDDDEFEEPEYSNEGTEKIHITLDSIQVVLESLREDASHQNRTLEELRVTQKEAANALIKLNPSAQNGVNPLPIPPDRLDLAKRKDIELLEKALIEIACRTANKQKSFCDWIDKYKPLDRPRDFVSETHELLKEQLGKLVEDEDPRTDFRELVDKAKNENLFYSDRFDPIKPIPILGHLNAIRNRFIHPRGEFNQPERWSKAIIYLINLSLVWSKVVIEEEDNP